MTSLVIESNSLSRARDLISGVKLQSEVYTSTQGYKVYRANKDSLIYMDTLCLSSLMNLLVDASYLFGHRQRRSRKPVSDAKMGEAREAYAFVSGTGLDNMIKYYNINMDPDVLRSKFEAIWKQK